MRVGVQVKTIFKTRVPLDVSKEISKAGRKIPIECWSEIKNNEHVPYVPNEAIVEMINRGGRTYLVKGVNNVK
jgi:hypothetical protein